MLLAEGCHARASKGAVVVQYIYNINGRLSPFAERACTWIWRDERTAGERLSMSMWHGDAVSALLKCLIG